MYNQHQTLPKIKYSICVIMVRRSITLQDLASYILQVAQDVDTLRTQVTQVKQQVKIINHRVTKNQSWIKSQSNRNGFSLASKTKNTSSIVKYIKVTNHAGRKPNQSKTSLEVEKGPTTLKGIQFYSSLSLWGKSHVWSGLNEINEIVCIKTYNILDLRKPQIISIQKEKEILKSLNHPNIPKFYILKKKPSSFNLVMEYGGQMTLGKLIKSLNFTQTLQEREARRIFVQILNVFEYLEAKGLAHCNLSPDKIILRNKKVKVVSFRHSVYCNLNEKIRYFQKISHFMAPEIQSKVPYNPHLSDRWMLGIILLNMLISRRSFQQFSQGKMIENVRNEEFFFSEGVSQPARQLVQGFLKINPLERLSPQKALQSQWLAIPLFPKWFQESSTNLI